MLDREGFRPNVGIILLNAQNEVWWGKRVREHSWQFPQGGIKYGETPEQAMYRELEEEIGLRAEHVKIVGRTRDHSHIEHLIDRGLASPAERATSSVALARLLLLCMAVTASSVSWRIPPIICSISSVDCWVRWASARTSSATTAKPRPASPARAASMAALRASKLV